MTVKKPVQRGDADILVGRPFTLFYFLFKLTISNICGIINTATN